MCWQRIGFVGGVLDKWLRGYLHGKTWSGLDSIPTVPLTVFSEGCRTKKVYGLQSDEREREKEKSNSMRPPFLHTCYVTRNRWVENSREFDRREKLLAFSATSWSPCRGTWKLNRVGGFGFFSSLVLFFVTFSRICCECLRANLWLLSEIFLKIFFFFF